MTREKQTLLSSSPRDTESPQGSGTELPSNLKQGRSEPSTTAMQHYQEIFPATPQIVAMTPEEQEAAIRTAFYNEDTIPREKELKTAIGKIRSLVLPRIKALEHAAAALIQAYATEGCPTGCGPSWTKEHIEAAIKNGPHSSATEFEALKALQEETKEKVKNGYAKVIRYGDIINNLPEKLKISPVAMIPHKS